MAIERANLILYVRDQAEATRFYREVLGQEPTLDVPGMTEFALTDGTVLGLMPAGGIERLLDVRTDPDPSKARAEVYLLVDDPEGYHRRALAAGASELSPLQARDWGEDAAHSRDLDGHILAFARRSG